MEDFDFEDGFEDSTGGSDFVDLRETGVYDVTLKRVSWSRTKNGAIQLAVTVNSGGKYDDTFYQGNIRNIDKSEGFEVKKLLNPLKYINGVKALSTSKFTIDLPGGKKEIDIFDQFTEQPIKMAVQKTWSDYHKKWDKKIAKVFTEDGRTASEAEAGEEAKQIQWFLSDKFKDKGPKGSSVKPAAKEPEVDFDDDDSDFDVE